MKTNLCANPLWFVPALTINSRSLLDFLNYKIYGGGTAALALMCSLLDGLKGHAEAGKKKEKKKKDVWVGYLHRDKVLICWRRGGEESFRFGQKESSSKVILHNHPSLIYFPGKRDERRGSTR